MTDRGDDTICQLDEEILRRSKALRPFCTLELKELIEEAQLLLPREEMDHLLNTYVISDYGHRLLTDLPPLPLVVTPTDTRKPPKRHCPACLQNNFPDFLNAYQHSAEASQRCADCRRAFFDETCFASHRTKTHLGKPTDVHQQSICFFRRRCADCFKREVGFQNIDFTMWVRVPPLLSSVHQRPNPSLLHSRALTPQEIQDLKKSVQTPSPTSTKKQKRRPTHHSCPGQAQSRDILKIFGL